ncbi:MAG: hypothetical protein RSC72_15405 [Algoriella sp.]|uniref:hypothetical protein n=1 Tax=Algoriella sp. TaxID=1872434 RepID=UPI002FC6F2E3
MFKKITLISLVVFSTSTTFVSCSSDDESQQNQNSSYNVNPPDWVQGTWKNSNNDQFTFTSDDIQYSDADGGSWKFLHNSWQQTINNNKSKFYDKTKTDNYYEAEYHYYEGFLDTNIKVNKTGTNAITVKYTYFGDDGSVINVENYSLTKSN